MNPQNYGTSGEPAKRNAPQKSGYGKDIRDSATKNHGANRSEQRTSRAPKRSEKPATHGKPMTPSGPRTNGLQIPESITAKQLDSSIRSRLKSLTKENADYVARCLVISGLNLSEDPAKSYQYAEAAFKKAGRVDVVREAFGISAYYNGKYDKALRELRTHKRMTGSAQHLATIADCERALGKPEKAIEVLQDELVSKLNIEEFLELVIVVCGAHIDLNETEQALRLVEKLKAPASRPDLKIRVVEAKINLFNLLEKPAAAEAELALLSEEEKEELKALEGTDEPIEELDESEFDYIDVIGEETTKQ